MFNTEMMRARTIFQNIARMSQGQLKDYCAKQLKYTHEVIVNEDGFLYAPGKFPVLLVAHLDTVHAFLPSKFKYDKARGALSSPDGIGADDRCGVYMIFEIIKKYNCSVLFCEDEEIGGIGATKFIASGHGTTNNFKYIIELDRKGDKDAVFYDCDNKDFTDFICKDFYKEAFGTFSDISFLAPYLEIAAVNLSCGYYNAHTKAEYVIIPEMLESIKQVCKILERTDKAYEYIEYVYPKTLSRNISRTYDYYDDYYEEKFWLLEYVDENGTTQWDYTTGKTEDYALLRFMMRNQYIPYANIISIEPEDC